MLGWARQRGNNPPQKTRTLIISITTSTRELTRVMCVCVCTCTCVCVCLITVHTHLSVKRIAYVPARSVLKYDSEFGDYNAALVVWVYCRVPLPAYERTHARKWGLCVCVRASRLRSRALIPWLPHPAAAPCSAAATRLLHPWPAALSQTPWRRHCSRPPGPELSSIPLLPCRRTYPA